MGQIITMNLRSWWYNQNKRMHDKPFHAATINIIESNCKKYSSPWSKCVGAIFHYQQVCPIRERIQFDIHRLMVWSKLLTLWECETLVELRGTNFNENCIKNRSFHYGNAFDSFVCEVSVILFRLILINCCLMTPCGDIDLNERWLG